MHWLQFSEDNMKALVLLLAIFFINSVAIDSITTEIALSKANTYETNVLASILLNNSVLSLVVAKVLFALIVIALALWVYRKDRDLATKAAMAATAFSFGVAYNNLLIILGGLT